MPPPRMSHVRRHPAAQLARPLFFAGLIGLAVITLLDRGSTRMYGEPWNRFYWVTVTVPFLLLLLRLADQRPWQLPTKGWLLLAVAAAVTLFASAGFSPYPRPCLQLIGLPLAGIVSFLLVHDWLEADPSNPARLVAFQTGAAATVMTVSIGYWILELTHRSRDEIFSRSLFDLRNSHPLGHSNYTAGLALLSLPWLVSAVPKHRGPLRLALSFATGLALLALFMSGSRGGLAGLGALGIGALLGARLGRKKFLVLAAGAIVAAAALAVANPRIRAMIVPSLPDAEPNLSTVQRAAMLEAGFLMASDRPIVGWGPGSTPLVYPRFRQRLDGGAENVLQLHNTPIEIVATSGLAGLLVSAAFLGLAFRRCSHAPVAAVALAGYAVFSLTDFQLDVPVFVFALATLAAALARPGPVAAPRFGRWIAGAAWLAFGLAVGFGRRDPTPRLNVEALSLAHDPAQIPQAVALLNQSLALNPDQEIAHFNLGWLLLVADPAAAEKHFREAARLVPDKGGVYFGLGLARLNQGNRAGADRALALECLNEPLFLASPWWTVPEIAAEQSATRVVFAQLTTEAVKAQQTSGWASLQAKRLGTLASQLGTVSPGPEKNYRRERVGYPVLVRDANLVPPADLYDVREDPRFGESLPFALPHKGWLPSPLLAKLLDGSPAPDR